MLIKHERLHPMENLWPPEDIEKAVETIRSGGIILYPTDTIWGLGCDATNADAVARIYALKERKAQNPLICLVSSIEMLKEYADSIHPRVETLLTIHERPLTIIYPSATALPDIIKAEDGSAGIRVSKDQYCTTLIEKAGVPIVSTSANVSGSAFPSKFGEITSQIFQGVDYICKYRQSDVFPATPSVVATYNKRGDLDFLRT